MFSVFNIDPPWPKKKGGTRAVRPNQGRLLDYKTMSIKDIFSVLDQSVFSSAEQTHTVFLWAIDQFLFDAEYEMEQREYRRHARLIWDKENGVAPCFSVRYTHEYLLWFYKPYFTPVALNCRGKFTTVLREPAREHSRKPNAAYSFIEAIYPEAKRLDVFSRESRPGWAQFGDQLAHFKSEEQK